MVTAARPSNGELGVLLWQASRDEAGHRRLALERAAQAARSWPEEAADVAESGRPLTELRSVGPWLAARMLGWIESPPPAVEPDPTRTGYLTMAQVRGALGGDPSWETTPHGDLQMHSTDSDGRLALPDMVAAARASGRTFMAATDHSKSLQIAGGQDEEQLADQGRRIAALNASFADDDEPFRILRSIEMDVFVDGSGDMDPEALADLDLVLGAFHTKLRVTEDSTDRYLAALRNPTVHVLAHPKARMYGRRPGLVADWPRVFDEAAALGKAIELDATPNRQDLNVELARIAVAAGVRWFSMGTDAHSAGELENLPFAMATAVLAGIPCERFLNYLTPDQVVAWAEELSAA